MKYKKNSAKLTMAIIGTLLLLGVSSAQAVTVNYSGNTATGIENLRVNGIFYDVEFVRNSADIVYGNPKAFDFSRADAIAAVDVVVAALNTVPAVTGVGPSSNRSFLIGYQERTVTVFEGTDFEYSELFTDSWQGRYFDNHWVDSNYDTDESEDVKTYAVFTETQNPTCTDNDGDSFAVEGGACGAVDCNDNDAEINPDAIEVCDGIDNNCNSIIDGNNICEDEPTTVIYSGNTATGIENLGVKGSVYDVEFVFKTADEVYGNPPDFDFDNQSDATAALEAAIAALNGVPAVTKVGQAGISNFQIGYSEFDVEVGDEIERYTENWQAYYFEDNWINTDYDPDEADDVKSYAVFTSVSGLGDSEAVPRYRLYNPNTFIHFYTTDANEYNTLGNSGWNQEGISSRVYDGVGTIDSVESIPYFRLYNPNTGVHFWTTDANEYNTLGNSGWTQEGEDGYLFPSQVSSTVPWYRLYNPFGKDHFWTLDVNERNRLIAGGWIPEGIDGYVFLP